MLHQKDTRFLLFLSVGLIACLALATNPRVSYLWRTAGPFSDELDKTSYRLAGSSAVDCGAVTGGSQFDAEYKAADRCAVEAFRSSKPFRVRHEYRNEPQQDYEESYVRTPDGRVYRLAQSLYEPFTQSECKHPAISTTNWPEIVCR